MRAILAVLILAAGAPAAQAASLSIPATVVSGYESDGVGPVALAAAGVVWVESRGTAAVVLAAGADGVPRQVAALPPKRGRTRHHALVASGTNVVLQRHVCRRRCDRDDAAEAVRVDLTTGATTPLDLCPDDPEDAWIVPLKLRGTVLAADCPLEPSVTDLADGTRRFYEGGRVLAAAGDFVARILEDRAGGEPIAVENWRTGGVVTRVAPVKLNPIEALDVDADGTLALVRAYGLHVVAPGGRTTTRPAEDEEVALVGGVLATRFHALGAINRLRVGDRVVDGQDGGFGWAFDGARLAWVAQPCAQTVVQVWDLAGDPPAPADARCATARVGTVRLVGGDDLRVRLTCSKTAPPQGCGGFVRADLLVKSRTRGESDFTSYKLAPGAATTVSLGVKAKLRRPLAVRVRVNDTTTRRRVR